MQLQTYQYIILFIEMINKAGSASGEWLELNPRRPSQTTGHHSRLAN
jgi:hypothetical protein